MKKYAANAVLRAVFVAWIAVTLVFVYAALFFETPVRNALP